MKIRGPLITLAVVAAVGVGILLVNIASEPDKPPAAAPATSPTTTTAAPANPAPPPPAFPAKADYVGKIPTNNGVITLEITVDGDNAIAYACDGNTVEVWLRGGAANGVVNLTNKDKTSKLDGRLQGTSVAGTLNIGEKQWDFTAAPVQPPAGLYVYEQGGTRSSWIVDENGAVTGVQRNPDGSTGPAPALSSEATRVEGDSDV